MKKLIGYFLQGILYIAPIGVTLYVLIVAFIWLDGLLLDLEIFQHGIFSKFSFPGIGLVIILLTITLVGFIGQKLITTPISSAFDALLKKAPLIKMIYSSVKDLLSAFVGKERKFEKPVIVTLDKEGILHRLGFITATDLNDIGIKDKIAVYLPSSYGVLGELYIVPSENIKLLDANSADVMKFIVSGGVTKVH
ncbi:DUF502 domain-containing protein [Carboxylicivirga linearis]|uniref:DUF502 domain-containing protein n=1 Tax=Carboxylicivirga linearis TaxID=1628157 RepID=A0ABS5JTL4_9BACT|nr:DUF502 domain-containing protein [Carboxylicivirga linearis]MBS2098187.1 DUF502 domain-containing protein [Carboxylicivirga linearis]